MIEIKTCAGMGDLILTYSILEQIKHNYSEIRICPDYALLSQYRSGSLESYVFTKEFARLLFSEYPYKLIDESSVERKNPEELSEYLKTKTKYINLADKLCLPDISIGANDYVVINTKVRNYNRHLYSVTMDRLKKILSNKKIVLMGERNIGINKEANDSNNIYTIYGRLSYLGFVCLDLTKEVLLDYPDINNLRRDLTIMKNAKCVINFGVSGTVMLSAAVANCMAGVRSDSAQFITDFFSRMGEKRLVTDDIVDFLAFVERNV